jgi:hypothetical protein
MGEYFPDVPEREKQEILLPLYLTASIGDDGSVWQYIRADRLRPQLPG